MILESLGAHSDELNYRMAVWRIEEVLFISSPDSLSIGTTTSPAFITERWGYHSGSPLSDRNALSSSTSSKQHNYLMKTLWLETS